MKIKIYEFKKGLAATFSAEGSTLKEHFTRELKCEVEIEDAEIITMVRRVLAKGVVAKE